MFTHTQNTYIYIYMCVCVCVCVCVLGNAMARLQERVLQLVWREKFLVNYSSFRHVFQVALLPGELALL